MAEHSAVPAPTRVQWRGIAMPWVLGLYGLAGATFIVATHMAHWYGGSHSDLFLFPFAAIFGGIATFLAGMWAYASRDTLATAMLGTWGSFWMAFGLLNLLVAAGRLTLPSLVFPAIGFWFIALAAITWMGAVAAASESTALVAVFGFLAAASTIAAIANLAGAAALAVIAGWLFIVAAVCSWYTATAMMLGEAFGRSVLPFGSVELGDATWPTRLHEAPSSHRVA